MKMPCLTAYVATALMGLALVGCDATDTTETSTLEDATATEDAAVSIANALGVESGGALDEVASVAETAGRMAGLGSDHGSDRGCEHTRSYDEETQTWTREIACERGTRDRRFYAAFSRTHQFQFLVGDTPQQVPRGATTLLFDIVDGTGERRTPVFHHVLDDLEGSFTITDFDQDLVTANGTYARAAIDTLRTHRAVRTLAYTLDLVLTDVVGPRARTDRRGWHNAVSGTVDGHYQALVTFETRNGYREREIDRPFTITFGETDTPVLVLGDRRFPLDLASGTVDGLAMD